MRTEFVGSRWQIYVAKNNQVAKAGGFPSKTVAEDEARTLRRKYPDDAATFWISAARYKRTVRWVDLEKSLSRVGSGCAVFDARELSRKEADKRIHSMIYQAVKSRLRDRRRQPGIGSFPFTVDELISHIERQFSGGMSWDNWGKWQIDHIEPRSAFDMRDPKQAEKCWRLENLQPLWAADNSRKGAKAA